MIHWVILYLTPIFFYLDILFTLLHFLIDSQSFIYFYIFSFHSCMKDVFATLNFHFIELYIFMFTYI